MTPVDVAFLIDNTGSMHPCIVELKRKVIDVAQELINNNLELKLSFILFGDYCDTPYRTNFCRVLDFSNNPNIIFNFLDSIRADGGGDAPEAYEYALWQAVGLNWRQDAVKVCVIVGDEVAHDKYYAKYAIGEELDWEQEISHLSQKNVNVYSVQALGKKQNTNFYRDLAKFGNGYQLTLDQFSHIPETVLAIGYKQAGDDYLLQFKEKLETEGKLNRGLAAAVNALLNKKENYKYSNDLDAVEQGRFQVLHVDNKIDIKTFVQNTGAIFQKGHGFYQLTKSEDVQSYKEVILQHKITGDLFTGRKARQLVGLPLHENAHIRPVALQDYNVFIQSTSNNRKLLAGTMFLYEVE